MRVVSLRQIIIGQPRLYIGHSPSSAGRHVWLLTCAKRRSFELPHTTLCYHPHAHPLTRSHTHSDPLLPHSTLLHTHCSHQHRHHYLASLQFLIFESTGTVATSNHVHHTSILNQNPTGLSRSLSETMLDRIPRTIITVLSLPRSLLPQPYGVRRIKRLGSENISRG